MFDTEEEPKKITPAQWSVIAVAIGTAGLSLYYKILIGEHLGHTALVFIGIPAILAVLAALQPKARSVTGGIIKAITLALLLLAPLLGEGYLCIHVAAPLFYIVGIGIGLIVDHDKRRRGKFLSCIAIVMVPMCLEGVSPELSLDRAQTVQSSRIVSASSASVDLALSHSPDIHTRLPRALRVGFGSS